MTTMYQYVAQVSRYPRSARRPAKGATYCVHPANRACQPRTPKYTSIRCWRHATQTASLANTRTRTTSARSVYHHVPPATTPPTAPHAPLIPGYILTHACWYALVPIIIIPMANASYARPRAISVSHSRIVLVVRLGIYPIIGALMLAHVLLAPMLILLPRYANRVNRHARRVLPPNLHVQPA